MVAVARSGLMCLAALVSFGCGGRPSMEPSARVDEVEWIDSVDVETIDPSGDDVEQLAADLHDARARGYRIHGEAIGGRRRSDAFRARYSVYEAGARRVGDRSAGYIATGLGRRGRIVAGGVRARWGEGLILAPRNPPRASPRWGPGPEGGVAGTASLWRSSTGVALEFSDWGVNAIAAGWNGQDDERVRLFGIESGIASAHVGICAATLADRGVRSRALSTRVATSGPEHTLAAEVAVIGGRPGAVVRAVAARRVVIEAFSAFLPSGFGVAAVSPRDLDERVNGAVTHFRRRIGSANVLLSLRTEARRTMSERRARRRAECVLGIPLPANNVLDADLRLTSNEKFGRDREIASTEVTLDKETVARLRLRLRVLGPAISQRLGLTAYTDGKSLKGTMASWRLSVSYARWGGDAAISTYVLGPGRLGYVSRPGVGGYESVSVVSGTGSDLSGRVRLRISTAAHAVLYGGLPFGRSPRYYGMLAISL